MEEILYDLWLSGLEGLGSVGQARLLEQFGSSINIFESCSIRFSRDLSQSRKILEYCHKENINIVRKYDKSYPARLAEIDDAPILLFYRGTLDGNSRLEIAIVGSRKATHYGRWAAQCLGETLGRHNVAVVSGMAYGVDGCAHKGAIDADGYTVAVLGCGVDICYPPSNRKLMDEILKKGAIVSEFAPGTPPNAWNFPRRNRIISGMSQGVIVVEAGLGSGSLITADFALEQGREVYAVPGNINSIYSIGSNKLIREGATPLPRINDILEELKIPKIDDEKKFRAILGKDEEPIYRLLKNYGDLSADQLAKMLQKPIRETRALISILEIKGIVESAQGKIFIAK